MTALGYCLLAGFVGLCALGVLCTLRDRREPPRDREWSGDRHGKARAYDRGEIIKHGGEKA